MIICFKFLFISLIFRMTFYHRALCHAPSVYHSVIGNFLDEKKEDILVSTGRLLKLLRFEQNSPTIQTLISVDTYNVITSLSKIRFKDETKDSIVIAVDSGTVTILTVNAERMQFEVFLQHDKAPIIRPVHHMAVDSHGRAVFIAGLEDAKKVWFVLHPSNRLSGTLDASEAKTLTYDIVFLDINPPNVITASLAIPLEDLHFGVRYEIRERRKPDLVFHELVENKLIEAKRIACLDYANSLISVPDKRGVLVCAEDFIAFYSMDLSSIVRCSIPKRIMDPRPGVIFVCSTQCSLQNPICYLAQTEQGDIFKIQLVVDQHGVVVEIVLKYLITLPVASALCTFKTGYLFVASEFGDQRIYRIADIERHAKVHPSFSSALALPKNESFLFMHRILDIAPVAEIKSLFPIMHMELEPLAPIRPRMYLATGRASLSALTISTREGSNEMPLKMWAIESTTSICKELMALIIVSFENSTAVYSLNSSELIIEKMRSALFAVDAKTLGCAKTGNDAIVQICPDKVCLITEGKKIFVLETGEKKIKECALNKKHLFIAFENKTMQNYEINEDGLVNVSKIPRRLLNGCVTCMHLSDRVEIDQLLAVGISVSPTKTSPSLKVTAEVHLFHIGLKEIKLLCMLKIENSPYSFLFANGESDQQPLLVGCKNGTVLTLSVKQTEETEGDIKYELGIEKNEVIGSEAVQLCRAPVGYGILAVSDHSCYKETLDGNFIQLRSHLSPCICSVPESEIIATVLVDQFKKENLKFFKLEDLLSDPSTQFGQNLLSLHLCNLTPPITIPLEYTPKKFAVSSNYGNIFIIESDMNSYTEETKKKKMNEFAKHVAAAKNPELAPNLPPLEKMPKSWASVLRVINFSGVNGRELFKEPFEQNLAALSFCLLEQNCGEDFLLVGVAKDFRPTTNCCTKAYIYTYKILDQGDTIRFLHKTDIKSAPLAMSCYEGGALIGIGRKLAIYYVERSTSELKLLCEKTNCVSNAITAIYPVDDRIFVSDSDFGMSCLGFCPENKSLHLLEEDIFPPEVTGACTFYDNRMVRATKSKYIFIVELGILQADTSRVYTDDGFPGTLSKEIQLGCIHIGEIVTSMQIFNKLSYESDAVLYTTLSGSIRILSWQKDAEFLLTLDAHLLKFAEDKSHNTSSILPYFPNSQFRSRHYKCKNVIDGDFLDEFLRLEVGLQQIISQEMRMDINQISTKLETIRREMMSAF